jgi:hypothetical protein
VHGDDEVVVEARMGAPAYVDEGAECRLQGADISQLVRVRGVMFPTTSYPGSFSVVYECAGNFGNEATPVERKVVVRDTTCPTCHIVQEEVEIEASFPYLGSGGANCTDTVDGPITDVVEISQVDVTVTGKYFVTFRARDAAGNWNDGHCKGSRSYRQTVTVVDTLKPVISLRKGGDLLGRRLLETAPVKRPFSVGLFTLGSIALVAAMLTSFKVSRASMREAHMEV